MIGVGVEWMGDEQVGSGLARYARVASRGVVTGSGPIRAGGGALTAGSGANGAGGGALTAGSGANGGGRGGGGGVQRFRYYS